MSVYRFTLIGVIFGGLIGFMIGYQTGYEVFGARIPLSLAFSQYELDRQAGLEQWKHCLVYAFIGGLGAGVAGYVIDQFASASRNDQSKTDVSGTNSKPYDEQKWRTLVDVDPEISKALTEVQTHGAWAEEKLATKFLALNDKAYLAAIVEGIGREASDRNAESQRAMSSNDEIARLASSLPYIYRTKDGFVTTVGGNVYGLHGDGSLRAYGDLGEYRAIHKDNGAWAEQPTEEEKNEIVRRLIQDGRLAI